MEITITEALLFCWAAFATAYAFSLQERVADAKRFTLALLSDDNFYKEVSASMRKMKEAADAKRV